MVSSGRFKNNADVSMYLAIEKLDNEDYGQAIEDSFKEIGIKIEDGERKMKCAHCGCEKD